MSHYVPHPNSTGVEPLMSTSPAGSKEWHSYTESPTKKPRRINVPVIKPIAALLLGTLLAFGHHWFNVYADGKRLDFIHGLSQVWINRIGTAFAISFKSALSVSLGFVLCQLMWSTLRSKFLTFQEIENVYLSADRDVIATFLSKTFLKSPLLVIIVAVTFLLPIPTIIAPSSLRVESTHSVDPSHSCQVPTGNLTNGGPGSTLFATGGWGYWTGTTPVAQKLAYSTLVGQKIPSLPQPSVCNGNCTYNVSFPSIAYQCQEGIQLPAGQSGTSAIIGDHPLWNATTNNETSFYVYWKSTTQSGTNGSAVCNVGTAMYDFEVKIEGGQQFIDYNVTHTGDMPPSTGSSAASLPHLEMIYSLQVTSIASAIQSLLLGNISLHVGASTETPIFNSFVISAAFFDSSLNSGKEFTWGNVSRGIERLSHNVSAAILTMDLGVQDSKCALSSPIVVYKYKRFDLWLPYGVALLIVSISLILGVVTFFKMNPENLTSSLYDTVSITRHPSLNIFSRDQYAAIHDERKTRLEFRLGELKSGGPGFGMREDLKLD